MTADGSIAPQHVSNQTTAISEGHGKSEDQIQNDQTVGTSKLLVQHQFKRITRQKISPSGIRPASSVG